MKIGILCAGDEELAPFLPLISNCKITEKAMLKFHAGQIDSVEVVALFSGVCKVNAAIAAQLLIDVFCVDIIINSGTAGGMEPELEIFDTVISTEVCYHDVAPDILTEFHPWMNSVFFVADPKLIDMSKSAVDKLSTSGKVVWGRMVAFDLREAHKDDFFSVPEDNPLEDFLQTAEETTREDSDPEQAAMAFICKRLKLNYPLD